MLNKKGRNAALFCFMCGITTEESSEMGRMFFRSPSSESKTTGAICSNCVADTYMIVSQAKPEIRENRAPKLEDYVGKLPTPMKIYQQLNKYVMGQENAKKAISIALANHFQKIYDSSINKTNVLLMGPTGTGKTELARAAAKILDLPFVIADATTFTAHGYVGEDVESILTRLLHASNMNLEKAQTGIVFIDEIDKLADKDSSTYVGTLAVQQSLLKILEGTVVSIPKEQKAKGAAAGELVQFDTSRVLFICAGAFSGLTDIVSAENKKNNSIGFSANHIVSSKPTVSKLYQQVNSSHLVKFGIIPEFLGRFQVVTSTSALEIEELQKILTEPVNSITTQYKKLLSKYNVDITFSNEFLKSVAQEALISGIGARGLKSIMEKRLENILFEYPDIEENKKKLTV